MKLRQNLRRLPLVASVLLGALGAAACASDSGAGPAADASAGSNAVGGPSSGGSVSTGGTGAGGSATTGTGGSALTSGGSSSTGGAASGGVPNGAGGSSGGADPAGGVAPVTGGSENQTGGAMASGGSVASGGSAGATPSAGSGGATGGSATGGSATGGSPPNGELVAFPGAQGFGRLATGARGGAVYHVTNLNDSGAGSLRDAISEPNRTVVFDVGGVINISSRLVFKSNQTIAGQTAPGDGITIYGDGTSFSGASHTIVRYVRFRMGIGGESEKDTVTVANGHDLIWDNCSLSWGRDGNFDINQESGEELYNLTLQDSIVAQGLQTHSTGGLVQTTGTSILRSLYIDNNSRNPKARGTLQFINNVLYNWVASGYILGDTSGRSDGAMLGNYLIPGPETNGGTLDSPTSAYNIYAVGNYYDSDKDGTLNGRLLDQGDFGSVTWLTEPSVEFPEVPVLTAQEAFQWVRDNAGASLHRDEPDDYVIAELDSLGQDGATISDEASLGLAGNVGTVASGPTPPDADQDGMPDAWESSSGLDPQNAEDRNDDRNGDGWTNLEEYINSLVP